ncbi:hypothetical protein GYB57_03290 [bacterium]|nr:hypothetical protein [bacterium]
MLKVLQILGTYLLLPLFLVGTFHYSIVTFNFQFNQEYITEMFCVNKDKPELACGGQCHFMKQMTDLKKADEGQHGEKKTTHDERTVVLYYSVISDVANFLNVKTICYPSFDSRLLEGFATNSLAPPESISIV